VQAFARTTGAFRADPPAAPRIPQNHRPARGDPGNFTPPPASADEPRAIFSELPAGECNLATIYRAMQLLEKLGMVKRFDFGDGAARFELVAEGDDGHHHHLICTKCAGVVEIEEPVFRRKSSGKSRVKTALNP
jgi:hypothetical protein